MESSRNVGCCVRKGCVRVGAEHGRESKVCGGEDGAWLSYYHGRGEAMSGFGEGRGGGKGKERSGSICLILASLSLFSRVNYTLSWYCLYYFLERLFFTPGNFYYWNLATSSINCLSYKRENSPWTNFYVFLLASRFGLFFFFFFNRPWKHSGAISIDLRDEDFMPFDLSSIRIFLAHNAWNWSSSRQSHVKLRIQDLQVNCPPMAKLKGSSPKRHILLTKKNYWHSETHCFQHSKNVRIQVLSICGLTNSYPISVLEKYSPSHYLFRIIANRFLHIYIHTATSGAPAQGVANRFVSGHRQGDSSNLASRGRKGVAR